MGFLAKDPALVNQIGVVATDIGIGQFNGRQIPKMRLWVLADRTAIVITPAEGGTKILRETYRVESGTLLRREKKMVVNLYPAEDAEQATPLLLDSNGCGCGFGIVSNAPPTDEPHFISNVRAEEWWAEQA